LKTHFIYYSACKSALTEAFPDAKTFLFQAATMFLGESTHGRKKHAHRNKITHDNTNIIEGKRGGLSL